ncbi:MAG: aldo/keto reductase [Caldilineaceae bacterium]
MQPDKLRQVGKTALHITQFGLGGTGFGNIYKAIGDQDAQATIDAAWQAGIRYFDTAPLYGGGLSEIRVGKGLARYPRAEFVISTKVGWRLEALEPGSQLSGPEKVFDHALPYRGVMDYSLDAAKRSLEESLQRLNTDNIEIVLMHDPDESISLQPNFDPYAVSHFKAAMEHVYPWLDDLRRQGVVKAIGVGMNQWQMLADFANAGDFDCFVLAGRYTLLEQESLQSFLPLCEKKRISIIVGGPYNSGVLATGATPGAYYNYAPAPQPILDRVQKIQQICAYYNIPLPSAALQFPFGHPTVAAIIPGARSAAELQQNIAYFQQEIPADFWAELKHLRLIDPAAPTPK